MECPLSESFLERLPKDNPYQICRFCVKETNDLLEIQQVSDFRILYLNLMNVEYSPGHEHPAFVCTSCMDMFRKITAFMGTLYDVDMFWKAYENAKSVPILIEATQSSSNTASPALPCGIVIKKDCDDQMTKTSAEENIMDFSETILTAETNIEFKAALQLEVVCESEELEPQIEKTVDIRPAIREIKKKKPKEAEFSAISFKEATKDNHPNCTKKLSSKGERKRHLIGNVKSLLTEPKRKDSMNRFIVYHPGARPFKCNICGGSFQYSLYLAVHLRCKHSGVRPFAIYNECR